MRVLAITLRRATLGVAILAFGVLLGYGYQALNPGPLVPLQDAQVAGVDPDMVTVEFRDGAGGYIEIAPIDRPTPVLFVLYPGGLVRPQAYTWIGVALARAGVRTLIPVMPLDLAVLASGRATPLRERYPDAEHVVIGGHSLGGAMAARYAARDPERVDALVLMGAFSAEGDDLSDTSLPVLVLAAEHDGLATLNEVRAGMPRLPDDAEIAVLPGGVHAYFGRYGPQRGDGLPTTTRTEVENAIATRLIAFVERVRRLP